MRPSEYNRIRTRIWPRLEARAQAVKQRINTFRTGRMYTGDGTAATIGYDDFVRARDALQRANVLPPFSIITDVAEEIYINPFARMLEAAVPVKTIRTDPFLKEFPPEEGWLCNPLVFHNWGLKCCGVKEIHGINNSWTFYKIVDGVPRGTTHVQCRPWDFCAFVRDILPTDLTNRRRPFFLFTDNGESYIMKDAKRYSSGDQIRDYIIEHKLGPVLETERGFNENSGNHITAYVWHVDWPTLLKWKDKR